MDAHGDKVSDMRVYWNFSNKKSGEKLPLFVWRLRMNHYWPAGEMKLTPIGGRCNVELHLAFAAAGANVLGILPVDSQWAIGSNGRMEREYLAGIVAELVRRCSPPVIR